MSKRNYHIGELQDSNGDIVYPHTEASVVFCSDGKTVQEKLSSQSSEVLANITGVTDSTEVSNSNILATSRAVNNLKTELSNNLIPKRYDVIFNSIANGVITADQHAHNLSLFCSFTTSIEEIPAWQKIEIGYIENWCGAIFGGVVTSFGVNKSACIEILQDGKVYIGAHAMPITGISDTWFHGCAYLPI